MKGPPERIYLQWSCEEHDADWGAPDPGDVTWCKNRIFNDDAEYVLVLHGESSAEDECYIGLDHCVVCGKGHSRFGDCQQSQENESKHDDSASKD